MNVLITGITGFIGSRLASRLVGEGYDVHGLVRHSSERELSRIRDIISQVHLIEGDLGTFHSIISAVDVSEPEIIFHLRALTPVRWSTEYLVSKMLAGETCYVGSPESMRDYMFAEDHVNSYILTAKSARAIGEVYNVSPGNPVTNSELAKMLTLMTGFKGKMVFGSYPPGYPQRPKSQDPQYLVLDNSKIARELGWKPSHTLQEGLKLTVELWRSKSS